MFKSIFVRYLLVGIAAFGFIFYAYYYMKPSGNNDKPLPVYGPMTADGQPHRISDFSFTDQTGKRISQKDFEGKIYVSDFFYTTCQGICPVMSGQMQRVYEYFKSDPEVMFLSHSVKPLEDSVPVLRAYAERHDADPSRWHFVTGEKTDIYRMARQDYMSSVSEGNGGPEDFVHTQFFTLVDSQKRIRGVYDGTDSTDVNKLIQDITQLEKEEKE
ncbi:MAG: SCO family protein [Bacteroidia bacterium]|nr:SCO family protein [Bacteroidia bacterium]